MFSKKPSELRGGRGHRMFEVSFRNEGAIDAGGPYREAYTLLAEDLMSDRMTLMLDASRARQAAAGAAQASGGAGSDSSGPPPLLRRQSTGAEAEQANPRVANPGANSEVEGQLFSFLGRYMGMVIRQQIYVPMQCASIFWKGLTGARCDELDLQRSDYEQWRRID